MHLLAFNEAYIATLDKAQAYEVMCRGISCEQFIELHRMLRKLFEAREHCDMIDGQRLIIEINEWLDHEWSKHPSDRAEANIFIRSRQPIQDINETLKTFLNDEKAAFEVICYALENNLDIAVQKANHSKQYTENGKLMKEMVCTVCGSKFTAHRQDAKYCSPKCRKAAGRAKE